MENTAAGGEVRKVHIVYFLSRSGRVEHPHLFRVHHFHRTGVFLRDVKRWLGDLRGREMPDAFAWSYKRRYKRGYIWQDLRDGDLITPISDNEYVLKGSEISPSPSEGFVANAEIKRKPSATMLVEEKDDDSNMQVEEDDRRPATDSSPRFGSGRSTLTDDSIKSEKNLSSLHSAEAPTSCEKDKGFGHINDEEKRQLSSSEASLSSSSPSPLMGKSKPGGGATQMIRSLLGCGAVDTNDKVFVMINRAGKNRPQDRDRDGAEISRDDCSGGSARMSGASSSDHQQPRGSTSSRKRFEGRRGGGSRKKTAEYGAGEKFVPAAYRPIGGPTCSQCGKLFKPEKLHSHMKSCKGMKKVVLKTAAAPPPPSSAAKFANPSAYFLTN